MITLSLLPLASSDWVAAGAGILGVVVGGVITTTSAYLLQRSADKRADLREQVAENRERDATISLLHGSLEAVGSYLRALESGGAWRAPVGEECLATWRDRARALAGFVERDQYETVAAAFLVARLLDWQNSSEGEGLSDKDRDQIAKWMGKVAQGLDALDASLAR